MGGTLTFRVPDDTAIAGWTQPFTNVAAKSIQPVTDLPSFVELIEGQKRELSPTGDEQPARLFESLPEGPVVVEGLSDSRRTTSKTWLSRVNRRARGHRSLE